MIKFGKHLRYLLKPSRQINMSFIYLQPVVRYAMTTSQTQQNPQVGKTNTVPAGQKILQLHPQGYGYYDWNDQTNYNKAMQDDYYLNDLIIGFRNLRNKKIQYTEDHLTFMVYILVLFPEYHTEIMKEFMPAFVRMMEMPDSHNNLSKCFSMIKTICYQKKFKNCYDRIGDLIDQVDPYLTKRILHPDNRNSLDSIHRSISINCYEDMGGLKEIMGDLKRIFYAECIQNNYKLSDKTIKLTLAIYQKLVLCDPALLNHNFFRDFPPIYETSEQAFVNMIDLLTSLLTFNFVHFFSERDLFDLHCNMKKLKYRSRDTKDILQAYSEHLTILNKEELINFEHMLDCI